MDNANFLGISPTPQRIDLHKSLGGTKRSLFVDEGSNSSSQSWVFASMEQDEIKSLVAPELASTVIATPIATPPHSVSSLPASLSTASCASSTEISGQADWRARPARLPSPSTPPPYHEDDIRLTFKDGDAFLPVDGDIHGRS